MAQRYHFPQAWIGWLSQLTEDEMIRLTNRGIYQRARKESECSSLASVAFEGDQASVQLHDDVKITLMPWLTHWTCSCPSRSVCKHVMISLLLLKAEVSEVTETAVTEKDDVNRFETLYSFPWQHIRKEIGDRSFNELRFRLGIDIPISIREEAYLTIVYEEGGIEVQFPPINPLKQAIVKPANADRLMYAAESLLRLQAARGLITQGELKPSNDWHPDTSYIASLITLLSKILTHGLARMADSVTDQLEQYALKAHRYEMPRIVKWIRSLKTQAEQYIQKTAAFNATVFKQTIVRLHRDLQQMKQSLDTDERKRLAGEYRSKYYSIPPIKLHALGIQSWTTLSGYRGTTVYLYSDSTKRWFTYTKSRPTFHDHGSTTTLINAAPWGLEITLDQFSHKTILLFEGRVNYLGRLSSSEKIQANVKGDSRFSDLSFHIYNSWSLLAEDYVKHNAHLEVETQLVRPFVAVCRVSEWGTALFNVKSQKLECTLMDLEGRELCIIIPYSPSSSTQIRRVEQLAYQPEAGGKIMGVIWIENGKLHMNPVTYFNHEGERLDIGMK